MSATQVARSAPGSKDLQCGIHGPKDRGGNIGSQVVAANGWTITRRQASMRPRPKDRGDGYQQDTDQSRRLFSLFRTASMRPRPKDRGDKVGSTSPVEAVPKNRQLLQCGHGPKTVGNKLYSEDAVQRSRNLSMWPFGPKTVGIIPGD